MKKRILYGIQCTGNGHLSRSKEIIKFLLNHYGEEIESIDVCLSGDFSQIDISDLKIAYKFKGLHLEMNDGKINLFKTASSISPLEFIKSALSIDLNKYDILVSDFEPVICWAALLRSKKIIGISNQYKFLSKKILKNLSPNIFLNKTLTKIACPVSEYISFDYLKEEENDFFPIIRETLRKISLVQDESYLVYLNTLKLDELIKFFELFPNQTFYIFSKECESANDYENLKIRPIDKGEFTQKLIKCKGVITHAGFQTTSEALFLGKKLLVIPISKQIEQIYNAKVLNKFGVLTTDSLNIETFNDFFKNEYSVKLNYYDESKKICEKIINLNGKKKN